MSGFIILFSLHGAPAAGSGESGLGRTERGNPGTVVDTWQ